MFINLQTLKSDIWHLVQPTICVFSSKLNQIAIPFPPRSKCHLFDFEFDVVLWPFPIYYKKSSTIIYLFLVYKIWKTEAIPWLEILFFGESPAALPIAPQNRTLRCVYASRVRPIRAAVWYSHPVSNPYPPKSQSVNWLSNCYVLMTCLPVCVCERVESDLCFVSLALVGFCWVRILPPRMIRGDILPTANPSGVTTQSWTLLYSVIGFYNWFFCVSCLVFLCCVDSTTFLLTIPIWFIC